MSSLFSRCMNIGHIQFEFTSTSTKTFHGNRSVCQLNVGIDRKGTITIIIVLQSSVQNKILSIRIFLKHDFYAIQCQQCFTSRDTLVQLERASERAKVNEQHIHYTILLIIMRSNQTKNAWGARDSHFVHMVDKATTPKAKKKMCAIWNAKIHYTAIRSPYKS